MIFTDIGFNPKCGLKKNVLLQIRTLDMVHKNLLMKKKKKKNYTTISVLVKGFDF